MIAAVVAQIRTALRRAFCRHSWRWLHGHGWSVRACDKCGEKEWIG